jgi:hypothetical protein
LPRPVITKPKINLRMIKDNFSEVNNERIYTAIYLLENLVSNNTIEDKCSWFWPKSNSGFYIDTPTSISVLSSVILYKPIPTRGLGSKPSENHVKC